MKQLFHMVFLISLITSCTKPYVAKNTMHEDVAFLSDDQLEGRKTGTDGEQQAADYIAAKFKEMGIQPKGTETYFQPFSFTPKTDPHQEINYTDSGSENVITGKNVIGYVDNKGSRTVIIGAHYDHLGMGGEGSLYREGKAIHNGADDNASGVAVMLNLAGKLATQPSDNNYLFIAFSGEEMGLLGSNYFVKNPTVNFDQVNFMINMDMVGRLREDKTLAVHGVGTSVIWSQTLNALNPGFKLVEKESGIGPSDHTSFYLSNIPVLHFFTGQHGDYHKPGDDSEKLNYEGMEMISDYILSIIRETEKQPKLKFKKTKNESEETPRFKVTLGVVPDYLFEGKGMRIDGVSENKPAQKAGLVKGDIVTQVGPHEVVDMMSYMKALSKFEKGETTKVVVTRNGNPLEVNITF